MSEKPRMDIENRVSDEQLNDPAQVAVRNIVKSVPEDSLSMAWRSGLNERLLEEGKRFQRRARLWFVLRPVAGLAFAGALAAVVFIRTGSVVATAPGATAQATPSLEAQLVDAHLQSAAFADVAGTGVRPSETMYASRSVPVPATSSTWDYDEVDIDSL